MFRLNEFTAIFQEIVNTYGIPNYKEVNPTPFNIITFPFMFGMMFGDIGHGMALFIVAVILCLSCDKIRSKTSGMDTILGFRYFLLLMGLFATFCGLMYNDFMAIPIWIFDSCYDLKEVADATKTEGYRLDLTEKPDCTYPIGLDPTWYMGGNFLTFLNSLKMKLSVIFGVA